MSQIRNLFVLFLSIFLMTWSSCHAESHNQTDSATLLPNPETLEATTGDEMNPAMDETVNIQTPNANKVPSDDARIDENGNQIISSGENQPPDDGVFLDESGNILNTSEARQPAQGYPLDEAIEAHEDIPEDMGTNIPLAKPPLKDSSNNTIKAPANATIQNEVTKHKLEQSQTTKPVTLPAQPQPPNGSVTTTNQTKPATLPVTVISQPPQESVPPANQTKPATLPSQPQPPNGNVTSASANQTKPLQAKQKAVKSSVTSPGKLEIIRGEGVRAPPNPTTSMSKPPEQSNSLKDHSIPQPVHPKVVVAPLPLRKPLGHTQNPFQQPDILSNSNQPQIPAHPQTSQFPPEAPKKDAVTVIKTTYAVQPPSIENPSPSDSLIESTLTQILKGISQTRVKAVISDDRPLPDRKTSNSDISKMGQKSEDDTFKSYPAEDDMIFGDMPVRPLPTEGQQAREVFPGVTLQAGKLEFIDSIRALEALKRLIEHKTSQGDQSPHSIFPQSDLLNKRGSCVGAPLGCIRCSTLQPTTCSADDGLQGHCWDACPSGCDPLQCVRCQRTCRI